MQLDLPGAPHLSYCTNIHAGESLDEIAQAVRTHGPVIKAQVCPDRNMGIGLRLSGAAAEQLRRPEALQEFADMLSACGLYVFTINAFPYGPFHGARVKEGVYEPDWRDPERLRFTVNAADILAALLPEGTDGSVSTVPGAYRSKVDGDADVSRMADAMIRAAAHLYGLWQSTGKVIALAFEPEPDCFIETSGEAVAFFEGHLFSETAEARFRSLTGTSAGEARAALRRHLTLCFDVCHAAVEYEDVAASLDAIARAGIAIGKVQLSSALRLDDARAGAEALLSPFNDGIYLHQTVVANGRGLERYADLPNAFAALRDGAGQGEWRVHCHVPLFRSSYGALRSTQDVLVQALNACRERAVTPHLEVETYTWGVLPADMRSGDIATDIARELKWVRSQLDA
jgi:sugar phosphate isomerase/epimerase